MPGNVFSFKEYTFDVYTRLVINVHLINKPLFWARLRFGYFVIKQCIGTGKEKNKRRKITEKNKNEYSKTFGGPKAPCQKERQIRLQGVVKENIVGRRMAWERSAVIPLIKAFNFPGGIAVTRSHDLR